MPFRSEFISNLSPWSIDLWPRILKSHSEARSTEVAQRGDKHDYDSNAKHGARSTIRKALPAELSIASQETVQKRRKLQPMIINP
jgi:hypothetical protein